MHVRLALEESEPGVTVMNLTQTDVPEEDMADSALDKDEASGKANTPYYPGLLRHPESTGGQRQSFLADLCINRIPTNYGNITDKDSFKDVDIFIRGLLMNITLLERIFRPLWSK
ncbi:hypothetical protein Tco_1435066 [Tanacetum coccineum]